MANKYYLMRKNEPVTLVLIDDMGQMISFVPPEKNAEIAPLQDRYKEHTWLRDWWALRSVPLSQGRIKAFLAERGYSLPSEYLVKNLGLSLTDYYWIKPVDSDLTWEKVNLFDNDFRENLIVQEKKKTQRKERIPHYSPNSSLQGQIEKTWVIADGERCLVKGNRTNLSNESINEVIASELHRLQGYDNYAEYRLIRIKGRDYDYGCTSRAFTSQSKELVSAYALFTTQKRRNDMSPYRHLTEICKKAGMDMEQLQHDLDYLILTDFVLSGYDRHLNNFGFLRDADTLKLCRMAPIFDSGGSLFANKAKPKNSRELLRLETNGLAATEMKMLGYVKNRKAVDLTKLPPVSFLQEMYEKDTQMSEGEIRLIMELYEKKIDLCRTFQKGKNLLKLQYD